MEDLEPLPIGRRVAVYRKLRGLTQSGLAGRMHRSESWVTKIERGERRIDSIPVLVELSSALEVSVRDLAGQLDVDLGHHGGGGSADLSELERALNRPGIASPCRGEPRPVAELQREAVVLRQLYHSATNNCTAVLPRLGALISQAQHAVSTLPAVDRPQAYAVLAEFYRLASTALRHYGDIARARVAIDRAMSAAEQADDLLLIGAASSFLTVQLWMQGDPAAGVGVATEVADLVVRDRRVDTPTGAVVLGGLHHYAAHAAACAGDEPEARRLLKIASRAAETLGRDRAAYGIFFGPVNLATMEMDTLVKFGRLRDAARLAEGIRPERLGSVVRSCYHYMSLTRAYSMRRQDEAALASLATGLRIAPEVVRAHSWYREFVRDLLHRRRHVDERLRRIARAMSIPD